jgi:hypothetical protein
MQNPTGALETFLDNFLLYIRTAFGTQFPGFEHERLRLLQEAGVFGQEPWIERLVDGHGGSTRTAPLAVDERGRGRRPHPPRLAGGKPSDTDCDLQRLRAVAG